MKISEVIKFFFVGYIDFEDRIGLRLYWIVTLSLATLIIGLTWLENTLNSGLGAWIFYVFILLFLVPFASILAKRLHDINLPGTIAAAFIVLFFIPILFFPGLILLGIIPGTQGPNKYGDAPTGIRV